MTDFKNVSKFKITGNYGKDISLVGKGSFTFLILQQSLLDDSVRGSFRVADTGYRADKKESKSLEESDDLNITTGEKVELVISDNKGNKIDINLAIEDVDYSSSSTMAEMLNVSLCSDDFIKMQFNKSAPYKHFDGKIHEIVKKVLTDHLKTEQDINVDPTLNTLPINGSITDNPLDFCTALAPKCIPQSLPKSSGYLFYNTTEGYNFKSIDLLFKQKPKRKMTYTESTGLPSGFTNKILKVSFQNNMNVTNILKTSSLTKADLETFDPYTNEKTYTTRDSKDDYKEGNAADEKPKIAAHLKVEDESTTIINQIYNTGVLPTGSNTQKQLENAKEPSFDLESIVRQSLARYNQLFLYKAAILIHGDFDIRPGDMIECVFPEISSKDIIKNKSKKKSGKYLVCDVAHYINAEHCYTRLNIVRDSIS